MAATAFSASCPVVTAQLCLTKRSLVKAVFTPSRDGRGKSDLVGLSGSSASRGLASGRSVISVVPKVKRVTCTRLEGEIAYVLGGGAAGTPKDGESIVMGNGRAIAMRLAEEGA